MNQDKLLDEIFTMRTTDTRESQENLYTQYKEKLKNSNFGSHSREYQIASSNYKIEDSIDRSSSLLKAINEPIIRPPSVDRSLVEKADDYIKRYAHLKNERVGARDVLNDKL